METTIVVIPVGYSNARKVCNLIENQVFESYNDLRNVLNSELDVNEDDDNQPQFFSMSDFMEESNDQLFDFEGSFISYVNLKN
jgi:hypothetical protein